MAKYHLFMGEKCVFHGTFPSTAKARRHAEDLVRLGDYPSFWQIVRDGEITPTPVLKPTSRKTSWAHVLGDDPF